MCCGLSLQPSPPTSPESRHYQHSVVTTSPPWEYAKRDRESRGACCVHMCVRVRGILTESISILLWWEIAIIVFWPENQINNWTKFYPVCLNTNLNSGHWIQQRLCEFILVNLCLHHLSHGTDLNFFFVPNCSLPILPYPLRLLGGIL